MRHLTLSGSPRERGLLHGKSWFKEIAEFAAIRKDLLHIALRGWSSEKISQLVLAHLAVLKKDTELWEEFCGISEGAKVSLEDLMILNNHTDLRDFDSGSFDETLLECSCFAFKKDNKILVGQTWDMNATATPYVAHITLKKGSVTQEIFTLTGCLGLTGITSHPFGVFINNLRSKDLKIGYAWPAVVRKLLDCSSLNQAQDTLETHMPSGGRNFLLCDANDASNFEVTANERARQGDLSSGYIFHTNHYLSHLKSTEEENSRSLTTFKRYDYLAQNIPEIFKSPLSIQIIGEKLLNAGEGIISIPQPKDNPHGSATCGGLLYDYSEQKGISFKGLFSDNDHLNF